MQEQKVNRVKLTKRIVECQVPDSSKRLLIWDTEITGFCIRIYPTGKKTYFLQYRNSDRETKFIKLGVHGNVTTEQAREAAKVLALRISTGEDPSIKPLPKVLTPTIEDLAEKYLKLHAENEKRPKSVKEDRAMLKNYILKTFGNRKVDSITFEDIQALHVSLNAKPILSNRIMSLLHKMFNLSVQWRMRTDNPVTGVKKYQEHKRTRWLQEEELERFWAVLDDYPNQLSAQVFKFLVLTGARKGEAIQATWDQIDLDKAIWTKPSHMTKQKRREYLPLSTPALEVLTHVKALTQRTSGYIFPGKVEGKPIQELKTFWRRVLREADITDVRIHDLRHTHASHLVSSGLSLSIVGKLLGHTQASTTQRYAHLADAPLRDATELFGAKVAEKVVKKTS